MKFALLSPSLSKTTICSSTTGPHMRLEQSNGVANDSTVGLPDRSARSSETSCIGQGGSRVQILATALGLVATGVEPERALVPTCATTRDFAGIAPWPAAFWPFTSMIATPSQLPAS